MDWAPVRPPSSRPNLRPFACPLARSLAVSISIRRCRRDYGERRRRDDVDTHTHTHTHNRLTAVGSGLPGWAGTRRNTHPLTPILVVGHPLSTSSIHRDPQYPSCSAYVPDNPPRQPLSRSSLVLPLVLYPPLHTPCTPSPSHHHPPAAHAHTNAACTAATPMPCRRRGVVVSGVR